MQSTEQKRNIPSDVTSFFLFSCYLHHSPSCCSFKYMQSYLYVLWFLFFCFVLFVSMLGCFRGPSVATSHDDGLSSSATDLFFFSPFSLLYLVSRPLVLCRRIFFLVDSRFVAWVCAPPRPFSSSVVGGDEGGIFWHQSETIRGLNFCTEMTTRADHQNAPGRIRKGPPRVKERKKKDRERQFRYVTAVDPRHFFPAPIPHTRALCM